MRQESIREENPLGSGPILRLIAQFAIPSIISMLVMAAYNITDQIFIGHVVGMLGNAATNVAFPTVTLTAAFAQMVGIGTAANFNMNMGANREEDAKGFLLTGLTMMAAVGILIGILVQVFKAPILLLCGATENVYPYALSYLSITAIGIPFNLFSNSGSFLIRADGSPSYSMSCTVFGAVLNILLDALFMFVFHWGIQGAALATVIGQILSAVLCLCYFPRFKSFKISWRNLGIQISYALGIMKLGFSNFINQTVMMLVNIILNNMLTKYGAVSVYGGDIPLAVAGVAAKLNSILSSFAVGLAMGCQPIWSFNLGAKKYGRVKETYKKALAVALCIGLAAFAVFQLFPRPIISIFGSGEELYFQFAERYLRIYMMMVCVYSVQPLSVNYFTGTGNVKQGILISLSRQGLFLIPLLLILPTFFGIDGVLYAAPVADALACVLALSMTAINFRKLPRIDAEQR